MPSVLHEALVSELRRRPEVVALLLGRTGVRSEPPTAATVEDPNVGDAVAAELRADLALRFDGPVPHRWIVEVQLRRDESRRGTWPAYVASTWRRHGERVGLLVLTPHRSTARWAAEPICYSPNT